MSLNPRHLSRYAAYVGAGLSRTEVLNRMRRAPAAQRTALCALAWAAGLGRLDADAWLPIATAPRCF